MFTRKIMNVITATLVATAGTLALLFLLRGPAPAHADSPHHVAPNCAGIPAPCHTTIQAAVDAAIPGDEIRVANGVYTGVQNVPALNTSWFTATQVAVITKSVTLRGGYNDDFTAWDPALYATTLDAEGLGRALVISGTITPTMEGLRITGGNASGLGGDLWANHSGGGVYVHAAAAVISNCVIYSNTTSTIDDGSYGGRGGGVYLQYSNATLTGNTIISNVASTADEGFGGGLYLRLSDAWLEGNLVQGNVASTDADDWGYGGGLYLYDGDPTLTDNTVQGNVASTVYQGRGGGLYLYADAATLTGNLVQGNTGSKTFVGAGGGLYLWGSVAVLRNNTVQDNVASPTTASWGGGLFLRSSPATLEGNTVQSNTASIGSWGEGGGLRFYDSAATLEGNLVQGNVASASDDGWGGGLYLYESAAMLSGNTIISNTAALTASAAGRGGGLWVYGSGPFTLTNNLVVGNHAHTAGGGLGFDGGPSEPTSGRLFHTTIADNEGQGVYVGVTTTLALTNTIIAGHAGEGITVTAGSTVTLDHTLWHGNGTNAAGPVTSHTDIYDDPLFADPVAWDYHLAAGSPAIDTGLNAGVATDIDGDPRPMGDGYDIGADEVWQYVYLPLVARNY